MYKVINIGDGEAEHACTPGRNADSELFEVILKHRRFIYNCETPLELRECRGYHFRFNSIIICHRIYETDAQCPVIEDAGRRIARLPCLVPGKQHAVWFITPGSDGIFFFYGGRGAGYDYYHDKVKAIARDILGGLPGVTFDNNDILVSGGKVCGMDFRYNADQRTMFFMAGITYDAEAVKKYEGTFDFSQKKYGRFAGFNETGVSRDVFDAKIKELYEAVKWV